MADQGANPQIAAKPIGWITAKTYEQLCNGAKTGDYALLCRVSAGAEKPRKRASSGWVPLFASQQPLQGK